MRLATVLAVLAAAVTPATAHPRRAAPLHSATATPRPTLARASRGEPRAPLHVNAAHAMSQRRRIPRPPLAGRGRARGGALNWNALAACEASGNPRAVSADGRYFGLYQFDLPTWRSVGGNGNPADASPSEQTYRAQLLYAQRGRAPWPVCSRYL